MWVEVTMVLPRKSQCGIPNPAPETQYGYVEHVYKVCQFIMTVLCAHSPTRTHTLVRFDKRVLPLHVLGRGQGRLSEDDSRNEHRRGQHRHDD